MESLTITLAAAIHSSTSEYQTSSDLRRGVKAALLERYRAEVDSSATERTALVVIAGKVYTSAGRPLAWLYPPGGAL